MASIEIVLSPWARNTTEGQPSPKNYPHWTQVVSLLRERGYHVHQLSCSGEPDVRGCNLRTNDLPLQTIEAHLRKCATWLAPDNFLPHMAWTLGRPGVVIFGPSDPVIFGHEENVNLLKDRRFLRKQQFWLWSQIEPHLASNPDIFVSPEVVVAAVLRLAESR